MLSFCATKLLRVNFGVVFHVGSLFLHSGVGSEECLVRQHGSDRSRGRLQKSMNRIWKSLNCAFYGRSNSSFSVSFAFVIVLAWRETSEKKSKSKREQSRRKSKTIQLDESGDNFASFLCGRNHAITINSDSKPSKESPPSAMHMSGENNWNGSSEEKFWKQIALIRCNFSFTCTRYFSVAMHFCFETRKKFPQRGK